MMRKLAVAVWCAMLGAAGEASFAGGTTLTAELVVGGLNRPVLCLAPPGDTTRLFIVEQRGVIRILRLPERTFVEAAFLDISSQVSILTHPNDERGLLGMAFHPQYGANGYFYIYYIDRSAIPGDTVIARYQVSADGNVADTDSAVVIKTFDQPEANHNGGSLEFGPDGMLYVSSGDGGGRDDRHGTIGNGQSLDTLLGKILRLDVDKGPPYIPSTNPFIGDKNAMDEIWSYGLRNPWRISFDRVTGDLWVSDVGQSSWEEVNFRAADSPGGDNYGWRCMEGNHCFNSPSGPHCTCFGENLVDPVHEYWHPPFAPLRCSITGGYVYRGEDIPCEQGHYFFSDWCSGETWSLSLVNGAVESVVSRTAELGKIHGVVSFGEDARGELYMIRQSGTTEGEVFKIVAAKACPDPCVGGVPDCNENGFADSCDIAEGRSEDCDWDGVPDECVAKRCVDGAVCNDCDACTHDRCVEGACENVPTEFGDTNNSGAVDLIDIFCVLDAWKGSFPRCQFSDVDIADCAGDGQIDVADLVAVLDAFRGIDPCCGD